MSPLVFTALPASRMKEHGLHLWMEQHHFHILREAWEILLHLSQKCNLLVHFCFCPKGLNSQGHHLPGRVFGGGGTETSHIKYICVTQALLISHPDITNISLLLSMLSSFPIFQPILPTLLYSEFFQKYYHHHYHHH